MRVEGKFYTQKTDVENCLAMSGFTKSQLNLNDPRLIVPITKGFTVSSKPHGTDHRIFFSFIPRDSFRERDALVAIESALKHHGWQGADILPVERTPRWPSSIACMLPRRQDEEFVRELRIKWAEFQDQNANRLQQGQAVPIAFCGDCGGRATHMTPTARGGVVSPCGHIVHFGTRYILTNPRKGAR